MTDILEKLCLINGVSGDEGEVRNFIRAFAKQFSDSIEEDPMGNLYVMKKGAETAPKKLMLCAHMDEVGLIIKKIEDGGTLRFEFVGGVDRRVAIGRTVVVGKKNIVGVIGIKAVHLTTKEERRDLPKAEELYIDIGAKNADEAAKLVDVGDYAAFDSDFCELGDRMVKGKALDDRIGCAVLMTLIKEPLPFDTTFVFTVQEEVGLRGAAVAANRVAPDIALCIEATTAADLPEVEPHKCVCRVRRGPVIPVMDGATIYDPKIFSFVTSVAEKAGIAWQTKGLITGGTDAGRIHTSRNGVAACTIASPARYIHSPACMASLEDIENVYRLLRAVLDGIAADGFGGA